MGTGELQKVCYALQQQKYSECDQNDLFSKGCENYALHFYMQPDNFLKYW